MRFAPGTRPPNVPYSNKTPRPETGVDNGRDQPM